MTTVSAAIRPFRAEDAPAVVRIVSTVFAEYGAIFDIEGYDSDLAAIGQRYATPRAAFFVLDDGGSVVGCVAATDDGDAGVELHRLYLDPRVRGRGHGRRLVRHIVDWARARRAPRVFLWSDVRFVHAHALYESEGFARAGGRICEDIEKSREHRFELSLDDRPLA